MLTACLLLAACGGDDEADSAARDSTTPSATTTAEPAEAGCEPVEKPAAKDEPKLRKPGRRLDPDKTYRAVVETNCGTFTIELDAERAPRTGGSFDYLAGKGFYDGLTFHRIVDGFVIQGGDPQGTGEGGPGYSVVEAPPDGLAYTRGVVAMAKTQLEDPGTSGSQFFVVTGEDVGLPPEYALLGKVTEGLDVVERIGAQPTGADEQPVDPVVISKVTVEESGG